ncbi:peptide chain release factor 1 [Neoroseomonas oryzicola]|uniref:Peptide chain release factor 1 n=1 Tax=Neoroseomonas oryzicola TaxID=535904 RepID=A0A9X9WQ71_9PROT|nr:peptide chain release factor 1 [Neoroseomonas oryzicola]MBR0662481.1 peptide chain release factor 1 [Neoroseomonas oryzicola]NKE19362.1 peptide chain release factor 1 [Neoroseomonas oryzicola]
MSDLETDRRMAELERLLNDPEVRLDPHRVWALLAEIRLRLTVPRGVQPA